MGKDFANSEGGDGERPSGIRLTNTVALAALRSRRYFSRYFSFWLRFGSFFILALADSDAARGEEVRPPSRLMTRARCGASRAQRASAPGRRAAGHRPVGSALAEPGPEEPTSPRTLPRREAGTEFSQSNPGLRYFSVCLGSNPARMLRHGADWRNIRVLSVGSLVAGGGTFVTLTDSHAPA